MEAKIGRKGADFARFWPILEGAVPHAPLLDPTLEVDVSLLKGTFLHCFFVFVFERAKQPVLVIHTSCKIHTFVHREVLKK